MHQWIVRFRRADDMEWFYAGPFNSREAAAGYVSEYFDRNLYVTQVHPLIDPEDV